jgi:hypothetical protein
MVLSLVSLKQLERTQVFDTVVDIQLRAIHWLGVLVDLHENLSLGNTSCSYSQTTSCTGY